MAENLNKYIAVAYKLYTVENGISDLVEEATDDQPFQFITGYGIALDAFEKAVSELEKGSSFDFILQKDDAFGDYEDEHVLDLAKEKFCINGHFDHDNIYQGAIIPIKNDDGNIFYGKVLSVDNDNVKLDLNHPLAGKTLNFKGRVMESREATNDEIQRIINMMNGDGCCCGHHDGENCCGHHDGGGCCEGHHGDGDNCHHHHDGGCCGHHHDHECHHGKK